MPEIIITSSILILIILALRYAMRSKLSPVVIYALWAVVALRLLVPVSLFDSRMSVMNLFDRSDAPKYSATETEHIPEYNLAASTTSDDAHIQTEHSMTGNSTSPVMPQSPMTAAPDEGDAEKSGVSAASVLLVVWVTGAAAVLVYAGLSNTAFWLRLRRERVLLYENTVLPVYIAEGVSTPCLFGVFRPGIYLNSFAASDRQRAEYIINHEYTHYRHLDHIWAVVRVLCVSVYWFNPLVWVAASLSRQDSELACDSAVVKAIGEEHRLDYGRTLVDMMGVRYIPANVTLAVTSMNSGAKSLRERVSTICRKPKTLLWAAVAVCVVTIAAFVVTFTGAAQVSAESTASDSDILSASDAEPAYLPLSEYPPISISLYEQGNDTAFGGAEVSTLADLDYITGVLRTVEQYPASSEDMDDSWLAAELCVDLHTDYKITNDGYVIMKRASGGQAAFVPWVTIQSDNIASGTYPEGLYGFYKIPDDLVTPFLERLNTICQEHHTRIPDGVGVVDSPESVTVMLYDGVDSRTPVQRYVFDSEEQFHLILWTMRTEEWEEVGLENIPDSKITAQIFFDDNYSDHYYIMPDGYVIWKYLGTDVKTDRFVYDNANEYANGTYREGYVGGYKMPKGTLDTLLAVISESLSIGAAETGAEMQLSADCPDMLAEFSTNYDRTNTDRTNNLELAARLIDGTILQPGEEFSFNRAVGERTKERGFVRMNDYLSDKAAGGISQTATTLFNAAVTSGMEITEHHVPTYATDYTYVDIGNGVPELCAGYDAEVEFQAYDLRFVNSKEHPVLIRMSCENGTVTAQIMGTDDGVRVMVITGEKWIEDYKTVYMRTTEGCVNQTGRAGLTVDVFHTVVCDGVMGESHLAYTAEYLPVMEIIYTDELPKGCEYDVPFTRVSESFYNTQPE